MLRTFNTHEVRKQVELTSKLWSFSPCSGEHAHKIYQVAVPSCWETYPDFSSYRGCAAYTTSFESEGHVRLVFKGVSHTAEVIVDGTVVGNHYNAYTPFEVILKNTPNTPHTLEVKVDNSFSESSSLHIPNDYQTYGGITRAVAMEILPDVYIKYVHFTPKLSNDIWTAEITTCISNLSNKHKSLTVRTSLSNTEYELGNVEVPGSSEVYLTKQLSFTEVKPYFPESPTLYLLNTRLYDRDIPYPIDDLIERVGFRYINISNKSILFNNRPLRIKGFCRHEDHPLFGCSLPYQAMDYDLNIIKDLGGNSIRTSHYPNDEIFLDLCDEKGILVWEENHARGLTESDMRNPYFDSQCSDCIDEMIMNHYNHPSIYIWGILNECASETDYGRLCYQKQIDQIKSLDQSRPTSFASCKFKTDLCLDLPDVVSYNIYPKWYHNAPVATYLEDLYTWVQESSEGSDKPFLITEIGAGAIYGYHSHTKVKWTEERQAEILEEQINAVLSHPGTCGVYIWQFCDVRVSEEWFGSRPRTMNNKGIVDEYRRRKLSYEVIKKIYAPLSNYLD